MKAGTVKVHAFVSEAVRDYLRAPLRYVAAVMMGPLGQWHVADLFAKWWRMIPFPVVASLLLSSSSSLSSSTFAWLSELPHLTVACLLWRLWVLPTLLAQPFLRFDLLAEHTGCPTGPDMLRGNTRTTVTVGWYRWLAWNMPWHAEHHAYPFVPFTSWGPYERICKQWLQRHSNANRRHHSRKRPPLPLGAMMTQKNMGRETVRVSRMGRRGTGVCMWRCGRRFWGYKRDAVSL